MDILPPGVVGQGPGAIRYHFNQRNLLSGQETYEDGPGWVLQAAFVYDGDGNRLQQIDHTGSQPLATTYTNDIIGLSQVLVSNNGTTTTHNLFGLDLIGQDDGTETRFMLADGLGSVRVEIVGQTIETATTYEPYGKLLAQTGSSGTVYGFSGEQQDISVGLIFVRARYYNPFLFVFMNKDPWIGNARLSVSQNGHNYVNSNPVNLVDPSGLMPESSTLCDTWPEVYGFGLRKMCRRAMGPESDSDTLDAREEIYRTVILVGKMAGYGFDGMEWASYMLERYLAGNVGSIHITLPQGHPFTKDDGIQRATTLFRLPVVPSDEPNEIIPLLHEFLGYVSSNCTGFFVPSMHLKGVSADSPNYFVDNPSRTKGLIPRPYDLGYLSAFGHVVIDGTFQATGQLDSSGMFVNYHAQYVIQDRYRWYSDMFTPFPLGIEIPHSWAQSLERNGRARPYDFTITWAEQETVWISPDRNSYYSKDTGGSIQPLHTQLANPYLFPVDPTLLEIVQTRP